MKEMLKQLSQEILWTGDLRTDTLAFLGHNDYTNTATHCIAVAAQAGKLAEQFGADPQQAQAAGWLHDISAVLPVSQRLTIARRWEMEILPAEEAAPMLLHQKLSAVIAQDLFGVTDRHVLGAIRCHTTLRANASLLDKVVFVADKVAWDQPGTPPYQRGLERALAHSLDTAALCYLDHLWQHRETLAAIHPWFVNAYQELGRTAGA